MADCKNILFGADETSHIVAIEADYNQAVVYIRDGDVVTAHQEPFTPWLLLRKAEEIPPNSKLTELEGFGFKYLVTFENWPQFQEARSFLRTSGIDNFAYFTPEKQFMVMSGKTLFKDITINEIRRMQIDIETIGMFTRPESAQIILIAISDNTGYETVLDGSEPDMIREMLKIIKERNPDVLEGHNFFNFDLPFIAARAKVHDIPLTMGRNGSEIVFGNDKSFAVGGYSRPYTPARIHGRHVIDTLLAVQRYDLAKGELERYGLKECAKFYGFAEEDRVYIPGNEISKVWKTDPEKLKKYAVHDVRETRSLAALVCPSAFYITQMVPDSYQSASTSGSGEKINSILVREYLRQKYSIPETKPGREVAGGYTEVRKVGLIRNVVKCDVESLYPSLMLSLGIKPDTDTLDVFLPALGELTARRIDAKNKSKTGAEDERLYWDGLQNAFKILINSFYGYLGAQLNFNDPDAAEKVTSTGQEIVKKIASRIEEMGGEVIEIDTDGVYFQPPENVNDYEAEVDFIDKVADFLPDRIRLAHDGRYAAMVSLKVKNYALVDYNGKKILKGASLRSRADERFGKDFIAQSIDLLLVGDIEGVSKLYQSISEKIKNGQLSVEEFARRERVTAKTFSSSQRKRHAEVAKNAKVGDYISVYEKANGELGLVDDYSGDEDKEYVLDKLFKFACRLKDVFGEDFNRLFPNPAQTSKKRKAESAGQQSMDFG